jgi:hypothetical protein
VEREERWKKGVKDEAESYGEDRLNALRDRRSYTENNGRRSYTENNILKNTEPY